MVWGGSGFRVTAAVNRGAALERRGFLSLAWVAMPEHVPRIVVLRAVRVPAILRAIKQPGAPRAINRWKGGGCPRDDRGRRASTVPAGGRRAPRT